MSENCSILKIGKGDNLREEDEERSKLLSPELVMNQKMMLDSESPGLARASTGSCSRIIVFVPETQLITMSLR